MSMDRPDLQLRTKEISRAMPRPARQNQRRIVRLARDLRDQRNQRPKQEFKFGSLDDTLTVHTAQTGRVALPAGKAHLGRGRVHERGSDQALKLGTVVGGFVLVRRRIVRHEQKQWASRAQQRT